MVSVTNLADIARQFSRCEKTTVSAHVLVALATGFGRFGLEVSIRLALEGIRIDEIIFVAFKQSQCSVNIATKILAALAEIVKQADQSPDVSRPSLPPNAH